MCYNKYGYIHFFQIFYFWPMAFAVRKRFKTSNNFLPRNFIRIHMYLLCHYYFIEFLSSISIKLFPTIVNTFLTIVIRARPLKTEIF